RADGRTAIPAGSKVIGAVSLVDRGGRVKEQARLGVRFHTIILGECTELPLQTETIYREGESPTNASAAKVGGGAIGGAILGAILGGGKGAAIGGALGAGARRARCADRRRHRRGRRRRRCDGRWPQGRPDRGGLSAYGESAFAGDGHRRTRITRQ